MFFFSSVILVSLHGISNLAVYCVYGAVWRVDFIKYNA
jgi:hypothetical protein